MRVEPLDPDTHAQVAGTVIKALRQGRSPAEALHSAGLILSPAREKAIRVSAMQFVAEELERWRPAEFLRRNNGSTPADLYREIARWLEEHILVAKGQP